MLKSRLSVVARGTLPLASTGEVIYNIVVTIGLTSVLIQSGLCEPHACQSPGVNEQEGLGLSIRANCTTSHIEVMYERMGRSAETADSTFTILYNCQYPNSIKSFEDDQVFPGTLDTNSYSRTIEPISSSNWTQHGSTCYFYACYKIEPFEGPNTYLRTTRFTCVIVDVDICTQDCNSKGASACEIDESGTSPSGYDCVCGSGYVWNATHCENVDECNTTDPEYQHNCTADEGYWCLDLEGSFTCVHQCTNEEEWNGTSCISPTTDDGYTITPYATMVMTTDIPTTSNDGLYTITPYPTMIITADTPTTSDLVFGGVSTQVVPTTVGVLFFLVVVVGLLIGLFIALFWLHSKKRTNKSVYAEMNYYPDYPSYPGYVDKIDMNFEPFDSILAPSDDLALSVESQLNRLWENTCTDPTAPTLPHVSTGTPHICHMSSGSSVMTDLSSSSNHCGQNVDSCTSTDQSIDAGGTDVAPLRTAQKVSDCHSITRSNLDNFEEVVPIKNTTQHRCSCVIMESTGSVRQVKGHHFRQSSISTLESHFDLTGSGLTDTSGYVVCTSPDHLEDLEQT